MWHNTSHIQCICSSISIVCYMSFCSNSLIITKAAEEAGKDGAEKKKKSGGNAAIYGMAATLPAGPIDEMLRTYTDVVLKI